jgi:hypothetical protein
MQKNNTKNIHLFTINNKLNRNIFDCESIYNIKYINDNIYKYYHTRINENNYSDNVFLFNSSYINGEIADFIGSVSKNIKIIIYIDNKDYSIINNKDVNYIIDFSSSLNPEINIHKLPENIVNKSLYHNIKTLENKKDTVIYFSYPNDKDNIEKLKGYLYPRSNLPIKIFDNDSIQHAQNIGYTSEQTKQKLLLDSKYYIHDSNNYYLEESNLCGCIGLNLSDNPNLLEDIIKAKQSKNTNSKPYYYIDFIREIIDVK